MTGKTAALGVLCLCGVITLHAAPQDETPPEPVRPSFSEWLDGVRAEPWPRGIRQEVVDPGAGRRSRSRSRRSSSAIARRPRRCFRSRPTSRASSRRRVIRTARRWPRATATLLDEIGERYGVPPRMIVGIWGIESNFGKFSGVRPTIAALATLAWDPRRATFFRGELLDALEILNRGDIDLARMRGSWAGAMGQPQFMPSSYLKCAEDFDGDGRRDIWSIASRRLRFDCQLPEGARLDRRTRPGAARSSSRRRGRGRSPATSRGGTACRARRDMTVALPLARWQELGVRLPGGGALPKTDFDRVARLGTHAPLSGLRQLRRAARIQLRPFVPRLRWDCSRTGSAICKNSGSSSMVLVGHPWFWSLVHGPSRSSHTRGPTPRPQPLAPSPW